MIGRGAGRVPRVLCALLFCALALPAGAAANAIGVADVRVTESAGAVSATFTITRVANPLSGGTSIAFQTADATATAAGDYVEAGGTMTFGALLFGGTQTQQVPVALRSDALDEPEETFRLVIAGDEVADGEATAVIADDDPPPALSVSDAAAVAEGAAGAHASFALRLSAESANAVSVGYATADDTATAGQDYTARSGTIMLPAGSREVAIDVALLDDGRDEPAERFALRLSAPQAATLGDAEAAATILDDDPPSASAAAGATQPLAIPLSALGPSVVPGRATIGVSKPRLRRPSTVVVAVSCPGSAGSCSGSVTISSIPNPRSKIAALRKQRRLGRMTFAVLGGKAQTLTLPLQRADLRLLRRTGRMRVRAAAVTRDSLGRSGTRRVSGTLIARTAHSSPSR
jgi:hypothetical protein